MNKKEIQMLIRSALFVVCLGLYGITANVVFLLGSAVFGLVSEVIAMVAVSKKPVRTQRPGYARISAEVPSAFHAAVKFMAQTAGISMTKLIQEMIAFYINHANHGVAIPTIIEQAEKKERKEKAYESTQS